MSACSPLGSLSFPRNDDRRRLKTEDTRWGEQHSPAPWHSGQADLFSRTLPHLARPVYHRRLASKLAAAQAAGHAATPGYASSSPYPPAQPQPQPQPSSGGYGAPPPPHQLGAPRLAPAFPSLCAELTSLDCVVWENAQRTANTRRMAARTRRPSRLAVRWAKDRDCRTLVRRRRTADLDTDKGRGSMARPEGMDSPSSSRWVSSKVRPSPRPSYERSILPAFRVRTKEIAEGLYSGTQAMASPSTLRTAAGTRSSSSSTAALRLSSSMALLKAT